MQLEFIVLCRFLSRHLFIIVPTLDDLKGLPPWKVPEHIVLLPATIFTVFRHNFPLPGSSWQTFLCPQTTHILWNMLIPVFSIFKLSFLTSLIGTVQSGGVTWKLCVLDSQMKTSRQTSSVWISSSMGGGNTDVWFGPKQLVFLHRVFHGVWPSTGLY